MRVGLLVGVLLLAACTSSPPPPPAPTTSSTPPERVYLSLGDSYATGYSPRGTGTSFANLVSQQTGLRLINVACTGITSTQLRTQPGCTGRAPEAPAFTGTQLDAAVQALRDHKGRVGLVTVVIGGNDLAPCALTSDPIACATQALTTIRTNLATTLTALREAAGDGTPIVGLTYPDVFLGAWVSPTFRGNGKDLARRSVVLFRDVFNPALKAEYEKAGAKFADITAATGAYEPLTELVADPTYGQVPGPVAKACTLTFFCKDTDVHPTAAGHQAIATAVVSAKG